MSVFRPSLVQVACAAGLFGAGAFAAYTGATSYGLGRWGHLGAGAFPFLLGLLLCGMAVPILFQPPTSRPPLRRSDWAGAGAICAGVLIFAVTLRSLGLVPAVVLLTILSSLAEPPLRLAQTAALAAGLALAAWLIFIVFLGLPLDAVAWG